MATSKKSDGIRERGTGKDKRYNVQIRKAGHKPFSKTFRTKAEAVKWKKKQEVIIDDDGVIDTSGRTLTDAIDRYIDERQPETYQQNVLKWWKDELGNKKLSKLRKADIVEAQKKLQKEKNKHGKPIAAATVNRRVAALSAVLTCCTEEWFYIEVNPARIRSLSEDNERERMLADGERKALIAACGKTDQPALVPFVLCAMASGARAGELQNLRWSDVDLDRGVARLLKTKNGDKRVIPIQGQALKSLKKYQKKYPVIGNGFVFRNHTGTFPFNYRKSWGEAKEAAGITDLRFHDLRHDAASNLAMAGASLREIGELLGHRSAQMAKRYSHFVDDHVLELGKRIAKRVDEKK